MEQEDHKDPPINKLKKLTRTVPAAVSSATSSLASLTTEHNFKEVIKKARSRLWREPNFDDSGGTSKQPVVDDLIVLNDNGSKIEPFKRRSATRITAPVVKNTSQSRWHVPPPVPVILDEPIAPIPSNHIFQSATDEPKSMTEKSQPPQVVPRPLKPLPLPRKQIYLSYANTITGTTPALTQTSQRAQSLITPVPLPRTKIYAQSRASMEVPLFLFRSSEQFHRMLS